MTDVLYLLACGIVWNKTGCEAACQEVVRALHSRDPDLRCAAELVLARSARFEDCSHADPLYVCASEEQRGY